MIVDVEVRDSVAELVLNGPPANTISLEFVDSWNAALHRLRPEMRTVLVHSMVPGKFVAGGDLDLLAGADLERLMTYVADLQRGFHRLARLPVPVICVVDGYCLGGGVELALAADLVLATARSTFALPEVRLGLLPAAGGVHRLVRRIGEGSARSLLLTGRSIDAARAKQLGLVDELVDTADPLARARDYAAELAALPPEAVATTKRLTTAALEHTVEQGLNDELAAWRAVRLTAATQHALDTGRARIHHRRREPR